MTFRRRLRGVCRQAVAICYGSADRSGDQCDAPIGTEQHVGSGPAIEDAHDALAGTMNGRPGACKSPHRRALGRAFPQEPSRHSSWSQRTRSADNRGHHPVGVGFDLVKGNARAPSPSAARCALDMGVGPHDGVESRGHRPGRCRSPSSGTRGRGTGCAGRRGGAARAGRSAGALGS